MKSACLSAADAPPSQVQEYSTVGGDTIHRLTLFLTLFAFATLLPVQVTDQSRINGQLWITVPDGMKAAYSAGWMAGFAAASYPFLPGKTTDAERPSVAREMQRINKCIDPMTAGQVQAIIDKYVQANPEQLQEDISNLTLRAVRRACDALGPRSD